METFIQDGYSTGFEGARPMDVAEEFETWATSYQINKIGGERKGD